VSTVPGVGADFWNRKTNQYANCTCPPARYNPTKPKPTNPDCPTHGN
jgi:hypothetical protein